MEILELIGTPIFKKGSKIHIKKQNRGKFTEYCDGKVTQECIDKAKKSKNPTLRKRATFADNARKWAKHQQGGIVTPPNTNSGQPAKIRQWTRSVNGNNSELYETHSNITNIDGGNNWSGIMGDTEYFVRKDPSGYMVDVQGPELNYQAEGLKEVPLHIKQHLQHAYQSMNNQIPKNQNGQKIKRLNTQGMKSDPTYKKLYNWYIDDNNIAVIQDSLINRNVKYPQRLAILSQVIPENGGRATAHGNGAFGLVGWRGDRAKNLPEDLGGQTHKLMHEVFSNPKGKDWNHGGEGTNVQSGKEMYNLFNTTVNSEQATKALMKGYVRPPKDVRNKRIEFMHFMKQYMK